MRRLELGAAPRQGASADAWCQARFDARWADRAVGELTRIPADVQDSLITILSEKTRPYPSSAVEVQSCVGFCVIATANSRDKA